MLFIFIYITGRLLISYRPWWTTLMRNISARCQTVPTPAPQSSTTYPGETGRPMSLNHNSDYESDSSLPGEFQPTWIQDQGIFGLYICCWTKSPLTHSKMSLIQ